MQCPTCKQLGLTPSFFCTQDCFKANWKTHKAKHSQPPVPSIPTMSAAEMALFRFTGTIRPGLITPKRFVPPTIARPDYADHPEGISMVEDRDRSTKIRKWAGEDLDKIRRVCRASREILDLGIKAARPGVTTDEIDRVVHEATVERQMYPSPLNYYNFPKSVCTSANEIICHGIPDSRELQEGDILNIDVSAFGEGVHADLNETIFIGRPDDDSLRLVHCTYECLAAAINICKPGALYKSIGDAIEARASQSECSVVRKYTGHGVGSLFHTTPTIPHYGNNKAPGAMAAGHVFTIEPMINLGTWQDITWPDNWTSSTMDGKRSAQFEHSMVVTNTGVELLTDWADHTPWYRKQLDAWNIAIPTPGTATAPAADVAPAAA